MYRRLAFFFVIVPGASVGVASTAGVDAAADCGSNVSTGSGLTSGGRGASSTGGTKAIGGSNSPGSRRDAIGTICGRIAGGAGRGGAVNCEARNGNSR